MRFMLFCPQQRSNETIKAQASPAAETTRACKKRLRFFQRQKLLLKRQKLDASGYFQEQNTASLTASFEVALHIAKQKKNPNHRTNSCKIMCGRYGKVAFRRNKCKKDSTSVFI